MSSQGKEKTLDEEKLDQIYDYVNRKFADAMRGFRNSLLASIMVARATSHTHGNVGITNDI